MHQNLFLQNEAFDFSNETYSNSLLLQQNPVKEFFNSTRNSQNLYTPSAENYHLPEYEGNYKNVEPPNGGSNIEVVFNNPTDDEEQWLVPQSDKNNHKIPYELCSDPNVNRKLGKSLSSCKKMKILNTQKHVELSFKNRKYFEFCSSSWANHHTVKINHDLNESLFGNVINQNKINMDLENYWKSFGNTVLSNEQLAGGERKSLENPANNFNIDKKGLLHQQKNLKVKQPPFPSNAYYNFILPKNSNFEQNNYFQENLLLLKNHSTDESFKERHPLFENKGPSNHNNNFLTENSNNNNNNNILNNSDNNNGIINIIKDNNPINNNKNNNNNNNNNENTNVNNNSNNNSKNFNNNTSDNKNVDDDNENSNNSSNNLNRDLNNLFNYPHKSANLMVPNKNPNNFSDQNINYNKFYFQNQNNNIYMDHTNFLPTTDMSGVTGPSLKTTPYLPLNDQTIAHSGFRNDKIDPDLWNSLLQGYCPTQQTPHPPKNHSFHTGQDQIFNHASYSDCSFPNIPFNEMPLNKFIDQMQPLPTYLQYPSSKTSQDPHHTTSQLCCPKERCFCHNGDESLFLQQLMEYQHYHYAVQQQNQIYFQNQAYNQFQNFANNHKNAGSMLQNMEATTPYYCKQNKKKMEKKLQVSASQEKLFHKDWQHTAASTNINEEYFISTNPETWLAANDVDNDEVQGLLKDSFYSLKKGLEWNPLVDNLYDNLAEAEPADPFNAEL